MNFIKKYSDESTAGKLNRIVENWLETWKVTKTSKLSEELGKYSRVFADEG